MTTRRQPHAAWHYDPTEKTYTLIVGEYRCRVWHSTIGDWAAVISRAGVATASYSFASPEQAQRWCEQQLAAQR